MRKLFITFLVLLAAGLFLGACQPQDAAAHAVEAYYQALVAKDTARVTSLVCADWESNAQMEVDSFQSVEASLKDLSCHTTGQEGEYTLVSCTGKIIMSYNGEGQEIDLSAATYQVVHRGNDWLFCGYR